MGRIGADPIGADPTGADPTGADTRTEIRALTGLRGVAACWVMLYHSRVCWHCALPVRSLIHHGYLAVDLFFVLSGFVLAMTHGAEFAAAGPTLQAVQWRFLRRRFARTYPLFALVTLASFALASAGAFPRQPAIPLAVLPRDLLLLQAWPIGAVIPRIAHAATKAAPIVGPGWSISTEWGAYLLFPFLCALTLRARPFAAAAAALAAAVLIALSLRPDAAVHEAGFRQGPLDVFVANTFWPGLRCLAGFCLGLLAFRCRIPGRVDRPDRSGPPGQAGPRLALAATLGLLVALSVPGSDLADLALFVLLVAALATDRGAIAALLGWGPIYWLGTVSYSIYLVHEPILQLVRGQIPPGVHGLAALALDVAVWGGVLAVSALTYAGIERPARRWLNRPARRPVVA